MNHHVYSVKFHDVKHQIKTIYIYASSFDRAIEEAKKQLAKTNQHADIFQLYSIEKPQMVLHIAPSNDEVSQAAAKLQTIADNILKNA